MKWYEKNGRNFYWRSKDVDPYELLLTEIFLQKTQAKTVENVASGFLNTFPTPRSLAEAERKEIQKLIKPLGLYRQRSKKIMELAEVLSEEGIPREDEELSRLPGVGEYIKNAMLCFAYGEKVPVIDTNTSRIIGRVFNIKSEGELRRSDEIWEKARELLPGSRVKKFNFALIDFGAKICTANHPNCKDCPLNHICECYI